MSIADKYFIQNCTDIIENGVSDEGLDVRPVWKDTGEKAHTIKKFCIVNRYDLSKEFPSLNRALTSYFGYGRKNPTMLRI